MFAPKEGRVRGSMRPLPRALVYALAGSLGELFFTGCTSLVRTHRFRPHTSPLMLPIYALIQPLFEPVHEAIRGRVPVWGRALIYGGGFHAVEYVTGRLLRRLGGRQRRSSWRAARTSSSRPTGALCGAVLTSSGSFAISSTICSTAPTKASSVALDSVSVGSIMRASGTMSGK